MNRLKMLLSSSKERPSRRTTGRWLAVACMACATGTVLAPAHADTYRKDISVNYARMYATWYNLYFPVFPSDCANFVSQALAVGHSTFRYNRNPALEWFYNNRWSYSQSWINAHLLFNFIRNTNRGYVIGQGVTSNPGVYNSLEPGDLIFADWFTNSAQKPHGEDGWIDHVMIVTGRDWRGILISAHTTNHLDFPFRDILTESNTGIYGRYYYMRMLTQY